VAKSNCPWGEYFDSIRASCPWSGNAYKMNKILFVQTNENCLRTWSNLFPHTKHEAYVYTWPDKSAEWLETMSIGLNDIYPDSEWLWSHPAEGGESTPVPCLIQQDAHQLNTIRESIGYVDEN
jgi:hypothetical protein